MLWDSERKFEPNISRIIGQIPKSESTDIAAVQDSACADRQGGLRTLQWERVLWQ